MDFYSGKELLKRCYDELANLNGLVVKSEKVDCRFDDLLNDLSEEILKEPKSIEDYFMEWEISIDELNDKTIDLINLKETYNQMEQDIIDNTDFKEIYGRNNEQTRKAHVKNELKDLVDKKHDLEIRIEYLKRRIDFIKNVMAMQRVLIESGAME